MDHQARIQKFSSVTSGLKEIKCRWSRYWRRFIANVFIMTSRRHELTLCRILYQTFRKSTKQMKINKKELAFWLALVVVLFLLLQKPKEQAQQPKQEKVHFIKDITPFRDQTF